MDTHTHTHTHTHNVYKKTHTHTNTQASTNESVPYDMYPPPHMTCILLLI